ncbi:MAG: DUF5942 domain-containing protein, partial [Leptolyngbyaceae cyanobacterium CAN_BIN12]|nr:DUF5942 domain-containing protein [Leptolyngbyaceae cyanobacterium CAN_BIN12]
KLAAQGKISFQDFFRWLRDNGYLNPRFWIDGGVISLGPKLAMVLGSYLLAWLLKIYFPFAWTWSLSSGLMMGSTGIFFLRGVYLFDAPQWPFRLMGSSLAEMGSAVQLNSGLNPFFASILIPLGLMLLLLGHRTWKGFAIGSAIGMAVFLAIAAITTPTLMWLGDGVTARLFLGVNAILCFALARLVVKPEGRIA